MSTFVLVHGSWHGAWCWDKMVPRLEAAGHQAIAIDLPGHGADSTPLEGMTLASYADRVCETLAALPEPAILVGHSMAGVVISQAAEQCPERIRTLVYLAAYLPRDGESLLQLALTDAGSQITPALVLDEAHGYHYLREDARPAALYHDCSPADVARAQSLLVVEFERGRRHTGASDGSALRPRASRLHPHGAGPRGDARATGPHDRRGAVRPGVHARYQPLAFPLDPRRPPGATGCRRGDAGRRADLSAPRRDAAARPVAAPPRLTWPGLRRRCPVPPRCLRPPLPWSRR